MVGPALMGTLPSGELWDLSPFVLSGGPFHARPAPPSSSRHLAVTRMVILVLVLLFFSKISGAVGRGQQTRLHTLC